VGRIWKNIILPLSVDDNPLRECSDNLAHTTSSDLVSTDLVFISTECAVIGRNHGELGRAQWEATQFAAAATNHSGESAISSDVKPGQPRCDEVR